MRDDPGNPGSFPDAISLSDDGVDPPSFATLNTPSEGLADRTASLKYSYLAAAAVNDWSFITGNPGAQPTDTDVLLCGCWDPWYGQWLVAGGTAPGLGDAPLILGGTDGGKTWLRATAGSPRSTCSTTSSRPELRTVRARWTESTLTFRASAALRCGNAAIAVFAG